MNQQTKESASYDIIHKALDEVERRYGTGYPEYESGYCGVFPYHNLAHTQSVLDSFLMQAEYAALPENERMLGSLAAAAHDIEQCSPPAEREAASARWLEVNMEQSGCFSRAEIVVAQLAILGTLPLFDGRKLVGQQVSRMIFPSKSAAEVARFVACADFGDLYSAKGPLLAHDLYRELQGRAQDETALPEDFIFFQRDQVELLGNYEYPDTIGGVHTSLKPVVIDYAKDLLERLETGAITGWEEVVRADKAFMQKYS